MREQNLCCPSGSLVPIPVGMRFINSWKYRTSARKSASFRTSVHVLMSRGTFFRPVVSCLDATTKTRLASDDGAREGCNASRAASNFGYPTGGECSSGNLIMAYSTPVFVPTLKVCRGAWVPNREPRPRYLCVEKARLAGRRRSTLLQLPVMTRCRLLIVPGAPCGESELPFPKLTLEKCNKI